MTLQTQDKRCLLQKAFPDSLCPPSPQTDDRSPALSLLWSATASFSALSLRPFTLVPVFSALCAEVSVRSLLEAAPLGGRIQAESGPGPTQDRDSEWWVDGLPVAAPRQEWLLSDKPSHTDSGFSHTPPN